MLDAKGEVVIGEAKNFKTLSDKILLEDAKE
jgi:hypothetical protein